VTPVDAELARQIGALEGMTPRELREKWREVFGEETRSGNRQYLIKRLAWRIQANAESDLSERARRRAEELANDADLRLRPPRERKPGSGPTRTMRVGLPAQTDRRLPMPGTILTRQCQGLKVSVTVLDDGFEYLGEVYRSLTAVAQAVTGSHWNGYHFFGLGKKER
jgi:hypothetical protein